MNRGSGKKSFLKRESFAICSVKEGADGLGSGGG